MQHFLLSPAAKTLSLAQVFRMSDEQAEATFCKVRWNDNDGKPVCPRCGVTDSTASPLRNDADKWLKIVTHTPSDFQKEAIPYSRGRGKSQGDATGPEQEPKTMEDASVIGKTKLEEGNFEDAAKLFETALTLAPKNAAAARKSDSPLPSAGGEKMFVFTLLINEVIP